MTINRITSITYLYVDRYITYNITRSARTVQTFWHPIQWQLCPITDMIN